MYSELFSRDEEIIKLNNQIIKLNNENEMMVNTINTIIRKKCKRGESNINLNITLTECLDKNISNLNLTKLIHLCNQHHHKIENVVVLLLIDVLTNVDRTDVPCVMVDPNTIVYLSPKCHHAVNLNDFSGILFGYLQSTVGAMIKQFNETDADDGTDSKCVDVLNMFITEENFKACVKKTLKVYQQL